MDVYTMPRNMGPEFSPISPVSTFARALSFNEDSGYHTSYTPGSVNSSEISNENLDPKLFHSTLSDRTGSFHSSLSPRRRHIRGNNGHISPERLPCSPRRGRKRRADEQNNLVCSVPTPTSLITNGIQRLHVADNIEPISNHFDVLYPTTPVKRICRSNVTKLSPIHNSHRSSPNACAAPKKSVKKLNFITESQAETAVEDTSTSQEKTASKVHKSLFRPSKKVDIVGSLYKRKQSPVIPIILSYLDNKDTYSFSLVSNTWYQACREVSKANEKRKEYIKFIYVTKENSECREKVKVCSDVKKGEPVRSLKDNNYLLNVPSHPLPTRSPPGTPRTNKFKKYTKAASLDSRTQISCVRCCQPAKVTLETTGEEWAECSSQSCAFQFCKKCRCSRHPHIKCFQYDLEAPSPSKRKINNCVIGSRTCKRNLRRLLA